MSLTKFGGKSTTIILKGPEAHKLHVEFEVKAANEVSVSQPVVLATDGTIVPAAAGAKKNTIIGYAMHNGKGGQLVTVAMVGYTVIYASPASTIDAGPVKTGVMNTTNPKYLSVTNTADAADQIGWCIDKATTANDIVRVVLF